MKRTPTGWIYNVCTTRNQFYKVTVTTHYTKSHVTVLAVYSETGSLRSYSYMYETGRHKWIIGWGKGIEENVFFNIIIDGTMEKEFHDGKVLNSKWYTCCNECFK